VNRVRDVSFAPVTIRSKAQLFTNMTAATNYNNYWTRTNGYKTGASSHDASIATLSARAGYASGTCSTVACHSGVTVNWTDVGLSCDKCHTAP
jgi:predicted CxxxxCH...CXXCH cytochrome family protein